MDDEVLKHEILKLFQKKENYTTKEIAYLLGQQEGAVKRCLRVVAEYERLAKNKCIWSLKKDFKTK